MSFHLKDTEVELGSTPIENIFIEQFLPAANGNYVKVYLLAYKYALSGKNDSKIDHKYLSKQLGLTLSDVLDAWVYWENMGVVEREFPDGVPSDSDSTDFKVNFRNLTELYLDSVYRNKYEKTAPSQRHNYPVVTSDDLLESFKNPVLSNMFKEIDDAFRRNLHSNERMKILEFVEEYGMDTDVISKAFYIAAEDKGIRNIPYALGILRNWHGMGIRTFSELENMLEDRNERQSQYIKIKRAIGAPTTRVTPVEKTIIDRWLDEWKYSMELIMKACEKSSGTTNPSINYINGIISDWNDKNLRTIEEIEEDEKKFKEERFKQSQKKDEEKSKRSNVDTKFHNFSQVGTNYTNEELEEIWHKK